MAETKHPNMPEGQRCPIGPLHVHTYNAEHTECIWCGPGHQAWKPGVWVPMGDGTSAWSVVEPVADADTPEPRG